MPETFEIIHTNDYGKTNRFKTHSRDPVTEAINHINEKYFQSTRIREVVAPDDQDKDELFPALGRTTTITT
jgi:hypothetical protein